MRGVWSMAFRGRKSDIAQLIEKAKGLDGQEPCGAVLTQIRENKRYSKDYEALPDNERVRLIVDEGDDGDIDQITAVFRKLLDLVPVLDGALYYYKTGMSKERTYIYRAPGGGRFEEFTARSGWRDFEASEEDFDELEVVMDGDGVEWRVPKRDAQLMEIFLV